MLLYVNYPSYLHPEIIPGFKYLRWYGLMYLAAFFVAYLMFSYQVKRGELKSVSKYDKDMSQDDVASFFIWGITGLLLGARIFGTLVYDTGRYLTQPWLIFWPFASDGAGGLAFVGFQGMSYHGGFLGGLLGMALWAKKNKFDLAVLCDVMAASLPLGYTFGRFGNFANGELYGRITSGSFGMIFPHVPFSERFNASESWVREFAEKAGITLQEGAQLVNLPRHPSQLYEALFEGVLLWLFLWLLRKKKPFNGFMTCLYTLGYGIVRFVIEYFRQPDADIGYRIAGGGSGNIYIYESWKNISTGQILCAMMIAGSLIAMLILYMRGKRQKARA